MSRHVPRNTTLRPAFIMTQEGMYVPVPDYTHFVGLLDGDCMIKVDTYSRYENYEIFEEPSLGNIRKHIYANSTFYFFDESSSTDHICIYIH